MSQMDAKLLGARIREARERAGWKQGELGDVVGLDRTAVNKIESGSRKVTALELSGIAEALDVRMSSFFSDPIPAIVSHRASGESGAEESKIDRLLADLASEVEFVQSLAPEDLVLSDLAARFPGIPYEQPDSHVAAEALTRTARTLLGLSPDEPVRNLVAAVASVGLLAFSADLGVDTADAGTILLPEGGVSLINSHNRVGRRRLALAHELGHYLVADEYTVDWRVADQHSGAIEGRFDAFARALLLPEPGLRASWARHSETHELREVAVLVASEFRVDMATLAKRAHELSLVDSDDAAMVRLVSTTQTDIVEFGLHVPSDLAGTTLPVPFQKAVLRLFRDERISRERALDLLQATFDVDDLPAIRTRREDELWKFVS